jgi:hypothetical protein
MFTIDIGQLCIDCGENTSAGSGKWVDRIPADRNTELILDGGKTIQVNVDGYECAECQMIECDVCGELTLEYNTISDDYWACIDCHDCNLDDHDECEVK